MSNLLRELHCKFQDADYDDDIVSMAVALVNMGRWCWEQAEDLEITLEKPGDPERFYKMVPHFPSMKNRKSARNVLAMICKEEDRTLLVQNVFVTTFAVAYIYHFPTDKLFDMITAEEETERSTMKTVLLEDGMSPNLLKEPSGKDFSAIHL